MRTHKVNRYSGLALIFFVCLIFQSLTFSLSSLVLAQTAIKGSSLIENVVAVAADIGGKHKVGFGFIVGQEEGHLYIVSANHLVRGGNPGEVASTVQVRFSHQPAKKFEAKLLGNSKPTFDLAVLKTRVPSGLNWNRNVIASDKDMKPGIMVGYLGRNYKWDESEKVGKIKKISLDFKVHIDHLIIGSGSAGAPLLTSDGIVGMLVSDDTTNSPKALSVSFIERAFRFWQLPWNLETLKSQESVLSRIKKAQLALSVGDQFTELYQYEKAMEYYQRAMEVDPNNVSVRWRVIRIMRLTGSEKIDEALALLYQTQALDPALKENRDWLLEEAYLHKRGATSKHGDKSLDLAAMVLENANALYPNDPEVLSELGDVYMSRREQKPEGLDLLKRAIELAPNIAQYHFYYAEHSTKKEVKIREYYQSALLVTDQNPASNRLRRSALKNLDRIFVDLFQSDGVLTKKLALSIEQRAKFFEYVYNNDKSKSYSGDQDKHYWMSQLNFELGNYQKADDQIQKILEDNAIDYNNTDRPTPHPYTFKKIKFHVKILETGRVSYARLTKAREYIQAVHELQRKREAEQEANKFKSILEERSKGRRSYKIGIVVPRAEPSDGLLLKHAYEGYPFVRAGVKDGDKLLEFNHHSVEGIDYVIDPILKSDPGTKIPMKVQRLDKTLSLTLIVE